MHEASSSLRRLVALEADPFDHSGIPASTEKEKRGEGIAMTESPPNHPQEHRPV